MEYVVPIQLEGADEFPQRLNRDHFLWNGDDIAEFNTWLYDTRSLMRQNLEMSGVVTENQNLQNNLLAIQIYASLPSTVNGPRSFMEQIAGPGGMENIFKVVNTLEKAARDPEFRTYGRFLESVSTALKTDNEVPVVKTIRAVMINSFFVSVIDESVRALSNQSFPGF